MQVLEPCDTLKYVHTAIFGGVDTGPNIDLLCIQQLDAAPFCEN